MNGYDFVNELYNEHGLLEAYRIAESYLALQADTKDEEEKTFCNQIREALNNLDQI